nr:immunoglobulin light chain junction region [Macaca mulatta]MPN90205.1 immunoglobulin light chain junction region [Macaca mulatta]MPN90422.1 immunoglobulin light chain junction region [Macaca mulatta]
CIQGIQFPLTF